MIKLNMSMYDKIKFQYCDGIIPLIKLKFERNIDNTVYFDSVKIKDFFTKNNVFDENKVKKILLFDFIHVESNNELLINYFKTGCFISYVNDLETGETPEIEMKRIKEYIEIYKCIWIEKYIESFPNCYESKSNLLLMVQSLKNEYDNLSNSINKILYYKLINKDLRYKILVSCGIHVCPYCNRQFISVYKKNKQKRSSADLDHFYSKTTFTLFSLSLYNFIPSCPTCNRNFKSASKKKLLYPFEKGFEKDAIFKITYNSKSNLKTIFGQNNNFDLKLDIKDSKYKEEINNNNSVFNIEEIYQSHKSYVQELKYKHNYIYTESYIEMMNKQFKQLNLNRNQMNILLYGYTFDDEIDKNRILSKLTKDILNK